MTTQADTAHAPILPGADDYETSGASCGQRRGLGTGS